MAIYRWLIIVLLAALGTSAALTDVPTPGYDVLEQDGNFELRRYPALLVAEVTVEGDRSTAARRGFRLLANYIFGGNSPRQKIAMTAPVTQSPAGKAITMTAPVSEGPADDDVERWIVQFVMPDGYSLDSLPVPDNNRVRVRALPARTVAALRFSGLWRDDKLTAKRDELTAVLRARNLTAATPATYAFYDDPFTLPWRRRNEIHVDLDVETPAI